MVWCGDCSESCPARLEDRKNAIWTGIPNQSTENQSEENEKKKKRRGMCGVLWCLYSVWSSITLESEDATQLEARETEDIKG